MKLNVTDQQANFFEAKELPFEEFSRSDYQKLANM